MPERVEYSERQLNWFALLVLIVSSINICSLSSLPPRLLQPFRDSKYGVASFVYPLLELGSVVLLVDSMDIRRFFGQDERGCVRLRLPTSNAIWY